ncbi:acyltransferase [Mangrovitalea sediminis]|uniref:acyltransferase n=1 Tax=Mangrovitalea sediminis TaxID=1982043 RepID=UPI000BE60B81|nr:acyltransferase [Mangrovitalea sediminis]
MIRGVVKTIVKKGVLILVLPLYALYWMLSKGGKTDAVFSGFSQFLSIIPGKLGIYTRAAFYHLACPDTSDEISIGFLTLLSHRDTTIQKGVYIGPQCNIGKCKIGADTLIGSGVHILSGNKQHFFEDATQPIQAQGGAYQKISIGSDCWLGNSALVMANVHDGCIVAAGSVVTKETPKPKIIIAGNPAKAIGDRITKEQA